MCSALKISVSQMDSQMPRNTAHFGRSESWDRAACLELPPGLLGWPKDGLWRALDSVKSWCYPTFSQLINIPVNSRVQSLELVNEPTVWTPSIVGCCQSCVCCQDLLYLAQAALCSLPRTICGVEIS